MIDDGTGRALVDPTGARVDVDLDLTQRSTADRRGLMPMIARSHARMNQHGSPARPDTARALGIAVTDVKTCLRAHPL